MWAAVVALALGASGLVAPRGGGAPTTRRRRRVVAEAVDAAALVAADVAAYGALEETEAYEVDASAFPRGLEGTLYRLGPGRFERRGRRVTSASEGDGLLVAVTFRRGGETATARSKFVSTMSLKRERRGMEAAGAGTEANLANGGAVYWAGRLFALCGGAKPYQMDPVALGTQKLSELGGFLAARDDSFEPWVKVDAAGQRLVNAKRLRAVAAPVMDLFFDRNLASSQVAFFEFDSKFALATPRVPPKLDLDSGEAPLDWAMTSSKYVVVSSKKAIRIRDRSPEASAEANKGIMVPLADNEVSFDRAEVVNAYDVDAADHHHNRRVVVVDIILGGHQGGAPPTPRCLGPLVRYVIDPATATVVERVALTLFDVSTAAVAPSDRPFSTRAPAAIFAASRDGALVRIDPAAATNSSWRPADGLSVGAPSIVGAYVLALVHGPDSTALACFDAADVARGPLATAALKSPVPRTGFTGPFLPDVCPDLQEIQNAETLARLYARKSTEWNEIEGGFSGLGIKTFLFPKGVSGG